LRLKCDVLFFQAFAFSHATCTALRRGCHCIIPCCGDEIAGALSTRIQSLDVAVETKTRDNVFVTIIVSTQYMVLRDPERMYDAFYKLTDSREQIRSYIFDVVGAGCVQLLNSVCQLPLAIETYASGLVRLVSRIASADCFSSHSLVTQPLNL
jgi:hypothetical protein